MKNCKKVVRDFLESHGMYYECIDMKKSLDDFIREMDNGLYRRQCSSLQMIPSYIYENVGGVCGKTAVTVDIGGTHVRVASVTFSSDGIPKISDIRRYDTPGVKEVITRRSFFKEIALDLLPFIDNRCVIGCCFSFATQPEKDGDAVVLATGKQLLVPDLVGSEVGKSLREAVEEVKPGADVRVVVINDAVAVVLGGIRPVPGCVFDTYAGFIYGTGTNVSYFEDTKNIADSPAGRKMLVNVESCGYNGFPRGDIDIAFDRNLSDFGIDQFEKMVSGKYQGPLLLEILRKAAEENLFSPVFCTRLAAIKKLPTKELDVFLLGPYGDGILSQCCALNSTEGEEDRTILYYLIDAMIERSARLCAVVLAAVLCKTNTGRNPCRPAYIVAEGSTFYGSLKFRNKLDRYVAAFLNETVGVYLDFFSAEEATLTGAANAAVYFNM